MADALHLPFETPDDLTPLVAQPVKTEFNPHPSQEDDMPKRTVAENYADLKNQTVRIDNLEANLSEALVTVQAQAQMIANLEVDTAKAHARLDKAREAIQTLATPTIPATTPRTSATTPRTSRSLAPCEVTNCPGHKLPETSVKHAESGKSVNA